MLHVAHQALKAPISQLTYLAKRRDRVEWLTRLLLNSRRRVAAAACGTRHGGRMAGGQAGGAARAGQSGVAYTSKHAGAALPVFKRTVQRRVRLWGAVCLLPRTAWVIWPASHCARSWSMRSCTAGSSQRNAWLLVGRPVLPVPTRRATAEGRCWTDWKAAAVVAGSEGVAPMSTAVSGAAAAGGALAKARKGLVARSSVPA